MTKPTNVTYLLGAGASANALPVVSDMKNRMQIFLNFLEKNDHCFQGVENLKSDIIPRFRIVLNEAVKHSTPDTYAKKLFLMGNRGKEDIRILKFFLSAYFVFEQSEMKINFSNELIKNLPELERINLIENADFLRLLEEYKIRYEKRFWFLNSVGEPPKKFVKNFNGLFKKIQTKIDFRYDSFLATILETYASELRLPYHIKILSWNYDFQLELAAREFDPNINPSIYPNPNFSDDPNGKLPHIVKLNGTAGIFSLKQKEGRDNAPFIPEPGNKVSSNNLSIPKISAVLEQFSHGTTPELNFAWESDNAVSFKALDFAIKIMEQTNVLVIIGYSFPNFNRKIDKDLLDAFWTAGAQRIYYQAPQPYLDGLVRRLKGLTETRFHKHITPHDETDQFLIPYEI